MDENLSRKQRELALRLLILEQQAESITGTSLPNEVVPLHEALIRVGILTKTVEVIIRKGE